MGFWAAAGPAIAAVAGSAISGLFGDKQASQNRNFQRDMSNTAHQREVEDLRAAGLNPILSANRGASTPTGSVGTMQTADFANAAYKSMRIKEELNNIRADTQVKKDQAELAFEKKITERNLQNKLVHEMRNLAENNELIRSQVSQTKNSARATELDNVGRELSADILDSSSGGVIKILQMLGVSPQIIQQLGQRAKSRGKN